MKGQNVLGNLRYLLAFAIGISVLVLLPLMSSARPTTSVTITNGAATRQVRHLYLSSVNVDNWSADQLNAVLGSGQSVTFSNVSCNEQQIKVIAEDQDGCFASTIVNCGDNATWAISNATAFDCD